MNVGFRDLRWAIAVSQHSSIRKASDVLRVRQSTLSRRLRELEGELGGILFERDSGGTHVTEIGSEFLNWARRVIEQFESLSFQLREKSQGNEGHLSIGILASLSVGNLWATLVDCKKYMPMVRIHLFDGSSNQLLISTRDAVVDVAFAIGESHSWEGMSIPVWSERVVAAVAKTHVLNDHDALRWDELREETFLLPEGGPGTELYRLVLAKLGDGGCLRIQQHDVALDRMLTLVAAGWGIAPVLEGATRVTVPGVIFHEIRDTEGPTRLHFQACWRRENTNPALPPFLDLLRGRYPDVTGAAGGG